MLFQLHQIGVVSDEMGMGYIEMNRWKRGEMSRVKFPNLIIFSHLEIPQSIVTLYFTLH